MSTEAIQAIAQASAVAAPIGQGFVDRSTADANAGILRQQGQQAAETAAYNETLSRRDSRSVIAQQFANALAEGGADSSAIDVIRQNEVNLIADALAIRAKGKMDVAGFESKANAVQAEGKQAFASGLLSGGAELLRKPYERRLKALQMEGG